MPPLDLLATTAFGLEALVKRELTALGYAAHGTSPGRVRFRGDLAAICQTNLWLRTADRVLIELARFTARDFDTLFETTRQVPWHQWLTADGRIHVVGRSLKSQLSSVPACQRAVKKAIVQSLLAGLRVDELPETGPLYKVEVALLKDEVSLTLDTTGASLHKRGYRKHGAPAPLKETLAAALVTLSFWKPDRPLWDPFCGSGTIPIEAALIGRNRAPGWGRRFVSEDWPVIPAAAWQTARTEAESREVDGPAVRLLGTDADDRAVAVARRNAEQAGVADDIHFQARRFDQLSSQRQFGCLITNPPYGERLGRESDWSELYRSIPLVLRKLPTWSHFVLTSYPEFEAVVERPADRRRKLYNGRIECTYYQFHGPRPPKAAGKTSDGDGELISDGTVQTEEDTTDSVQQHDPPPPVPVFGGLGPKADEQAELFRTRLRKRARHLRRWPTRQGITCFRLYERDVPEIPLTVDRYEDHLHLAEWERPHDRNVGQHADWLDLMKRAAGEALDVPLAKVFLKRRQRQRGTAQYEPVDSRSYELEVGEGGLKFLVNLSDYLDTGLFLDHRITRGLVRDESSGKKVLNLFGYTGSFSVYAAAGGARETTTVDLSNTYLTWARRNLELNGFSGSAHQLVRSDARAYLENLPTEVRFDLAIVDPPTFSNTKRHEADWVIQDDYDELLNRVLARLAPDGVTYLSTNFKRFKLDESLLRASDIREISRQTVPEDFRNRRIHRCWTIRK